MMESSKRPKTDKEVMMKLSLKQQYITPNSVNLPAYHKKGAAPVLLQSQSDNNITKPDVSERQELDGFYLLEKTGMGFPEDAQQAVLSDKRLTSVVPDDFTYFVEMVYIDVSENNLEFPPFGAFPKLRELRMACNHISNFAGELYGFHFLMYLDLSYNKLTPDAVQRLWVLPELRELDLCGNNLKTLPKELYKFSKLEKILLDYNKIEDNQTFIHLCTMPNLRYVSLANNFLSAVTVESCMHGGLKLLETLDLSFNYFASEDSLAPIITLPRLVTLMLYGNPVLGPTGEDPMFIYIEKLVEKAGELRDASGSSLKDVDFLTEIPRKRTIKKGQALGRQALYRDFSVVQVDTNISNKTTKEWRKKGAETMFAEAMQYAHQKKPQYTVNQPVLIPDLTFLTNSIGNDNEQQQYQAAYDVIADDVMNMVSKEMGILNSAELLRIRDKIKVKPNAHVLAAEQAVKTRKPFNNDEEGNEEDAEDGAIRSPSSGGGGPRGVTDDSLSFNSSRDENDLSPRGQQQRQHQREEQEEGSVYTADAPPYAATAAAEEGPQEGIPSAFFRHPMSDPQTFFAQPVSVKTAMKALQLAVKQPLTNYDEVPSKFTSSSKEYTKGTASSRSRQLPRQTTSKTSNFDALDDVDNHSLDKTNQKFAKKGISEPVALRQIRKEQREFTLSQIDQVLDSLNESATEFTSPQRRQQYHPQAQQRVLGEDEGGLSTSGGANAASSHHKDAMNSMKYFARPYHGLKNLMDMVEEVEEEFRK